jgi:Domain of unknown function (DUF4352)
MRWLPLVLILLLVACGGGDDDTNAVDSTPVATQISGANATQSDAGETATENSSAGNEDNNNPDVHVSLSAGSSGEVKSDNPDPFATDTELGTLKVTIVDIIDNATTDNAIMQPEAGNRYWAAEVTLEATGDKVVNTGVWTVQTTDGGEYETIYLTGVGDDIIYGALEAGATKQGFLVFEIPAGATVKALKLNPSIYVGGNLFFDA